VGVEFETGGKALTMRYRVEDGVLSKYPRVKIGVLVGRNVTVRRSSPSIESLETQTINMASEMIGSDPITRHPFISSWRDMYRSFGTKPGDYRPSAEALLRRALKSKRLPRINTAVDAYNVMSVKHLIPMGGFDLDGVQGTIRLRFSEGGEAFMPLGSSSSEETYKGEPVYADDTRILTRRWNHRDCDETKITEATENLVMFADGSKDIPREAIERAVGDLSSLLKRCCGGTYASAIADIHTPETSL